jgi:hypothetical protein
VVEPFTLEELVRQAASAADGSSPFETTIPTTRNDRSRPSGIVSPVRQFVTVLSIVGGSAGVPSACSSLMVKVIQPPVPGPDGCLAA